MPDPVDGIDSPPQLASLPVESKLVQSLRLVTARTDELQIIEIIPATTIKRLLVIDLQIVRCLVFKLKLLALILASS